MTTTSRRRRGQNGERRMSLGQHLVELRKRLIYAAAGIALGAIAGWFLSAWLWDVVSAPVHEMAEARNASLNYPNITAAFDLRIRLTIYTGVILSSPVWLYQVFAYLVPGLTGMEKRYTFGFFFTAIPLFLAGCASGWFVLPHIVTLLTSFAPNGDMTLLVAGDYLKFVLKLVIAVGVAFVMPVFLVLLNFMGILSARSILKSWRIAMLIITIFTAITTPSADVFSMFLLAVPMVVLYFAAAGIAALHDRRLRKRAQALERGLTT